MPGTAFNLSSTALRIASSASLVVVLTVHSAEARGDPEARCSAAKLAATAQNVAAMFACQQSAALQGTDIDPSCTGKAINKLTTSFMKADARGGCLTTGDADALRTDVETFAGAMLTLLRFTVAKSRCIGGEFKATGRLAATLLKVQTKHRKDLDDAALLDGYTKAQVRFVTAFRSAQMNCAFASLLRFLAPATAFAASDLVDPVAVATRDATVRMAVKLTPPGLKDICGGVACPYPQCAYGGSAPNGQLLSECCDPGQIAAQCSGSPVCMNSASDVCCGANLCP